jgi:hypothetical protein
VVVSYCAKLHSDQSGTWTIFVRVCEAKDWSAILSQAKRTPTHTPHARAAEKGAALRSDLGGRAYVHGCRLSRYRGAARPRRIRLHGPFSTDQQRIAARAARLPTTYALAQPEAADHDPRAERLGGRTRPGSSVGGVSTSPSYSFASRITLACHSSGLASPSCCLGLRQSRSGRGPIEGAATARMVGRPLIPDPLLKPPWVYPTR